MLLYNINYHPRKVLPVSYAGVRVRRLKSKLTRKFILTSFQNGAPTFLWSVVTAHDSGRFVPKQNALHVYSKTKYRMH